MVLTQPLVVQVNDDQGAAVTGALVEFSGPAGVGFDPPSGLTDSSGQLSTNVALGSMAGRYQLTARTLTKAQKSVDLKIEEIALGYQEQVGFQLDNKYCARCHDPESTAERVSNYDNLEVKPHPFTEGDTLNKMTRRRTDRHHQPRRTRAQQVRIDAPVRLYSQQDRDRGADCLHPPDLRSSLSCFRNGLCTKVGPVGSALSCFVMFVASASLAQVVSPVEIKDPALRDLQQQYMDDLSRVGEDILSNHFDYPFYLSRKLDLDQAQQQIADQSSIRFDSYKRQDGARDHG